MNLSNEQCTMQDRKLPSHTSHMNLTGDGAGEAVTEASRTEIRVRLTKRILGQELRVMCPGRAGGGDLLSRTSSSISLAATALTVKTQPALLWRGVPLLLREGCECECYPAPAVVRCCACLHSSQQQQQQSCWEMGPLSPVITI